MNSWHRFVPISGDDSECTICLVQVADDALADLAIPCPVPRCEAPSNAGCPCVMVAGEVAPECAYCGRPGDLAEREHRPPYPLQD